MVNEQQDTFGSAANKSIMVASWTSNKDFAYSLIRLAFPLQGVLDQKRSPMRHTLLRPRKCLQGRDLNPGANFMRQSQEEISPKVGRNLSARRKNNFMNRENFHQVKTQFHEHFPRGNFLLVERKFPPNFSSSPTHLKMRFLSTFVQFSKLSLENFKAF